MANANFSEYLSFFFILCVCMQFYLRYLVVAFLFRYLTQFVCPPTFSRSLFRCHHILTLIHTLCGGFTQTNTHTQSKTPQTFCQNDWSIYVVGIVAAGNRENVESNGGQQKQNHSKFNMHAECLYENVQNACKCGFAWVSPCTLLPSLHPPFIFLFFERKRRKRPKHFVFIANCAFINW